MTTPEAEDDDWLEAMLRRERPPEVSDNGFSRRTTAALPARETPGHWPVAASVGLGVVLADYLTRGWIVPATHDFLADLSLPVESLPEALSSNHNVLALGVVAACAAWAACGWALASKT